MLDQSACTGISDPLAILGACHDLCPHWFWCGWCSDTKECGCVDFQIGHFVRFQIGVNHHEPASVSICPRKLSLDPLQKLAVLQPLLHFREVLADLYDTRCCHSCDIVDALGALLDELPRFGIERPIIET